MTMIVHKASNEKWIKNRTFAYGWMKLNKESCRIFYGQIPRKTMDEKKGEAEMVPYFIAPSRVILGHKSYSRFYLGHSCRKRFSQPLRALSRCGFRLRLFYPTPTDCLSGHFLLHEPPQTWPRCAISLTSRETSYKINVTRRCPLDEHDISSQVLEFTTLFCPSRGSIHSKLLHLRWIINLQSMKIEIEEIFNNFHFSFRHN